MKLQMKSKTELIGKKEMGKTVLIPALGLISAVPSPHWGVPLERLTRDARLEPKDSNLKRNCANAHRH
jgi:hypothetical protein